MVKEVRCTTQKGNISQHLGSKEVKSTQRLCLPWTHPAQSQRTVSEARSPFWASTVLGKEAQQRGGKQRMALLVVLGSICSTMLLRKHAEATHWALQSPTGPHAHSTRVCGCSRSPQWTWGTCIARLLCLGFMLSSESELQKWDQGRAKLRGRWWAWTMPRPQPEKMGQT